MDKSRKKRLQLLYKLCERLKRDIDDPSLELLSLEQLQYINHQLRLSCYLKACPGSGKTEVVGVKAAYEFSNWQSEFSGIAVLTFTRNAAIQIKKRVTKYAGGGDAKYPHFVGTIDSWLHSYLLHPFGYQVMRYAGKDGDRSIRVIESGSRSGFLHNYRTIRPLIIDIHQYYKDYQGNFDSIKINLQDRLDANLNAKLERKKRKFHADGFATYQDAEYICLGVLKEYPVIVKLLSQRFPHIIIDECQDLSDIQLCILYRLFKEGTTLHFVGDLAQAIYAFKKVDPRHVESFVNKQGFYTKKLTTNYRSNQSIVSVCRRLIGSESVVGNEPAAFDTPCILWQYTDQDFSSLPECFHKLVKNAKLDVSKCCVLARGKSVLEVFRPERGKPSNHAALFANALKCWYSPTRTTVDIDVALYNIGETISRLAYSGYGNHQNQYCPKEASSKDWRWFLAEVLDGSGSLYPFVDPNGQELSWSEWVRNLKAYLQGVWDKLPIPGKDWDNVKSKIRSPRNQSKNAVSETLRTIYCPRS